MNLNEIIEKSCKELGITININDYSFLNSEPHLKNTILIGLGGSYAYGTNIETSDLDIRGIATWSSDEILLGHGFEQVVNEQTDTTIYSLNKIVNLLINCNPNTIEMLGLKPEHYLYKNPIGQELIKNADMFLSQKCIGSFMGYANGQLYRLQQKSVSAMTSQEFNSHIVKTMQSMKESLSEQLPTNTIDVYLKDGEITIDLNVKEIPLEKTEKLIETFNKTLRDYNTTSKRNKRAETHNKIAKHSMHLVRLYMMCEDILTKGEINTYREKEHDLLMSIRNGEWLDSTGKPRKDFYDIIHDYEKRIEYAKANTILPKNPDIKKIEEFVKEVNRKIVASSQTTEIDIYDIVKEQVWD